VSAFGDAYKAIESVILLRSRVEGLEKSLENIVDEIKEQGRDMLDHERRLIRIETMIEMTGRRSPEQPRIEG
jgi:translation initiation factor 2 alpha subunit (eIF-2alpha)